MDVTGNWGVSEEGRSKKGEIEAEITSFLHFFSHSHFKEKKRKTHTEKESVNHLA